MVGSGHRSVLSRLLVSTALPFAVLATGTVAAYGQVDVIGSGNSGTNGASGGATGGTGGPGDPITLDNGYVTPNTNPWNRTFATGGAGGTGGDGTATAGPGGNGGIANATAGVSITSGPAEADSFA